MLSIIIPCYNEEKVLKQVILEIQNLIQEEYELIAVNDGSKDKTLEILQTIEGIKVINHPYNLGYGASLKTGIKNSKGSHILIIDADGTYPVKSIPELLKLYKDYDMVIGSRTGKNVQIPFFRKPAKFILSRLANYLTGRKIPDLNSGLRIFTRELAERFFHLFPSKFSFTTTITLAALTNDYTVKYIPIDYYKRTGASSIKANDFIGFTTLIIKVVTFFNPLKIFSLVSVFLFLIAFAIFLYSFIFLNRVMDITVIVILLAALQIFLFGIIAELIVKESIALK